MRDIFREYPEVEKHLDSVARHNGGETLAEELRQLITLVGELCYRDGMVDGMKALMDHLIHDKGLAWAALFIAAWHIVEACDWPYGTLVKFIT